MSAIIRRIYAFVQVRNGEYDISSTQGDLKERLGETRSMEYVRHRTPRRRKNISCFTAPASLGLRLPGGQKSVRPSAKSEPACVFAHRHNNDDDDDGGDDDYDDDDDDDDDNDDDVRPERKRIILKQKNTDVSRRGVTRSS
ncbi:hypothetical protein HZH68_013866 [Vespula germanica]|uniref:Uncharacterized protein n=1 Tax=Vespula germanica TaxID=30212 RepID=A0A834JD28_VESGE|nr:hypothetical protein HZH68_013866 [Vespula germanica]